MKSLAWIVLLIASTALVGCSGGSDPGQRIPTIAVKGKLLVDGQPFGPCIVYLASKTESTDPKLVAAQRTTTGKVKSDGTFVLTTYVAGDGVPAGSYRVSIGADSSDMEANSKSYPVCKEMTVDIAKPSDGKALDLELKLESTGEKKSGVSADIPGGETGNGPP